MSELMILYTKPRNYRAISVTRPRPDVVEYNGIEYSIRTGKPLRGQGTISRVQPMTELGKVLIEACRNES